VLVSKLKEKGLLSCELDEAVRMLFSLTSSRPSTRLARPDQALSDVSATSSPRLRSLAKVASVSPIRSTSVDSLRLTCLEPQCIELRRSHGVRLRKEVAVALIDNATLE